MNIISLHPVFQWDTHKRSLLQITCLFPMYTVKFKVFNQGGEFNIKYKYNVTC